MSEPTSIMPEHPPVSDWVHDFDHTDPRWTENPFPIWDELRNECPVVHTKRFLGCYLPTTYQAVKEIAYDTEHFSSRAVVPGVGRPGDRALPAPIGLGAFAALLVVTLWSFSRLPTGFLPAEDQGYLIAGVAVGPFTPGFVGDTDLAMQFAEIGVILLMFGVGLKY